MQKLSFQQRKIAVGFAAMIAITFILALSNIVWSQTGGANDTGIGYDALNPAEQEELIAAATGSTSALQQPEVLLIERHQENKELYNSGNWVRRGDVYVYDYASNTLTHSVVQVETGAVDFVEHLQGVQLPLTANEINRARAIAYANSEVRAIWEQEYLAITGTPLTSLDQLNMKAFIFYASAMPEGLTAASQQCGLHRCAQLLIYTGENVAFEMQPIIDLSTGNVVQLLGHNLTSAQNAQ